MQTVPSYEGSRTGVSISPPSGRHTVRESPLSADGACAPFPRMAQTCERSVGPLPCDGWGSYGPDRLIRSLNQATAREPEHRLYFASTSADSGTVALAERRAKKGAIQR